MTKMVEFEPVAANLKNDPDPYCRIKNAARKLIIEEIGHVKGYQDSTEEILSTVEKLNVIADKLATKAINEARCGEPKWNEVLGPRLRIDGKLITSKEGLMLRIAAEIEELHEWQREKLQLSRSGYKMIDWAAQHPALAKLPRKTHRFAVRFVYHWLLAGLRIKWNNQHEQDKCPLCDEAHKASSQFLRCDHKAIKKCFADIIRNLRQTLVANEAAHAAGTLLTQKNFRGFEANTAACGGGQ